MPLPDLIDNGLGFSQLSREYGGCKSTGRGPGSSPCTARFNELGAGGAPPRGSALFQHPVKELRRPAHLFGGNALVQAVNQAALLFRKLHGGKAQHMLADAAEAVSYTHLLSY